MEYILNSEDNSISSVSVLCREFGISRQSYYQALTHRDQVMFSEELAIQRVLEIRHLHPKMGGRKLYYLLGEELSNLPVPIGRDKLFDLLKRHNLLVQRDKRTYKTTNSNHNYWIHPNRTLDWKPNCKDQLWVSDITYIRLNQTFMYLALMTDAFSRLIVGFDISSSLCIDGSIRAAKKSILQSKSTDGLIHHSDRGVQYCSNDYVGLLKKNLIKISMTQTGSPYENAMAERVNGILKHEYELKRIFSSEKNLIKSVEQAVHLYNYSRPHLALSNLTPSQVHNG